jgi:two-component system LytT family response regulator
MTLFERNKNRHKATYSVLKENLKSSTSKKIALNTLNTTSFVETSDILFFQADGSYTKVFLKDNKTMTISKGLKSFETLLEDNSEFFRCHKSFIVNLTHISDYVKSNGGYLVIDKTHDIAVSSDKVDVLLSKITQFVS